MKLIVWSRLVNRNFRNGIIELKCFFPLHPHQKREKNKERDREGN